MGGVAAACQQLGDAISGSETDLYEPMKSYLASHGVRVFSEFNPKNMEGADRIVVGNAVSRGNEELEAAMDERRDLVSLPALISEKLIAKNTSIVVTGTHGKTTTTSMVAWLLESAGRAPGFLIGGVPGNFSESCRPAPSRSGGAFVIEGDEYDSALFDKRSKFLHYRPDIAILNNIEFDHADIFDSLEAIQRSFRLFARLVPRRGMLLANHDDANVAAVVRDPVCPVETVGLGEGADWRAIPVSTRIFNVEYRGVFWAQLECALPGEHNMRNMLMAAAAAHHYGVSASEIEAGSKKWLPPKRRLEAIGSFQGATVIDDFAHHPTAIQASIRALQAQFPGARLWVAFEPRSNTTTRNLFQRELAECFSGATGVALGPTDRPWRYAESERLNLGQLVNDLEQQGIAALAIETATDAWASEIHAWLAARVQPGDVVAVFTNGNFGGLRALLTA